MKSPADLRYTETHEWVRTEPDGLLTVGITHFAQESLGDLVFVELPAVGARFAARQACAVVESVKAASDVYAPVAGEVVAVNAQLKDQPEAINADAFSAWMFRLRADEPAAAGALMDAAAYDASAARG